MEIAAEVAHVERGDTIRILSTRIASREKRRTYSEAALLAALPGRICDHAPQSTTRLAKDGFMTASRRIVSAVARCWVSTSAIALALLAMFDGPSALTGERALGILGLTSLLTAGYGATLWFARRHLRDDAQIGGRRDLIAGFLAIVVLVAASILTQGIAPVIRLALCLLSGSIAAILMYFPWLQREPRGDTVREDA